MLNILGLGGIEFPLLLVFLIFLVVAYKVLHIIKNVIFVSIISAFFPFVLERFFNYGVVSLSSMLSFMILGVGLYLLYEVFSTAYNTSKLGINLIFAPLKIIWLPVKALFKKKKKHEKDS